MIPTPMSHALLRAAHVFDEMTEEELDAFTVFVRERRLLEGEAIFREGDEGRSLFVMLQGEVAVALRGPRGESLRVARLVAGDVIGEQCCLEPGPRSATLVATSRVLCLELTREALDRMMYARPRIASRLLGAILQDLSERLRAVDHRIAEVVDGDVAPRAAPASPVSPRPSPVPPRPSPVPPRPSPARPSQPPAFTPPPPSAWERLRARFGGAS